MNSHLRILAVASSFFCAATVFSQTATPATKASVPASAPASATASAPAATAAKTTTAPGAKSAGKTAMPTTAAAGGGDGKVWVNTKSNVYHCDGTKYYGKTKVGEYMTEADAKAKGNHADHGKACVK